MFPKNLIREEVEVLLPLVFKWGNQGENQWFLATTQQVAKNLPVLRQPNHLGHEKANTTFVGIQLHSADDCQTDCLTEKSVVSWDTGHFSDLWSTQASSYGVTSASISNLMVWAHFQIADCWGVDGDGVQKKTFTSQWLCPVRALRAPCTSLLICFSRIGWVCPWQLGTTFSQAAAHWRLKPGICSSGSIWKDLLLPSHDFIIIIIILMKFGSWAHYKALSPSLTWNSLFSAIPPQLRGPPPRPVSAHCWRALRGGLQPWMSAWVFPPPRLPCLCLLEGQ